MRKIDGHERHHKTKETFGETIDRARVGRWQSLTEGSCLTRILTFVLIIAFMVVLGYCYG
ncbi:hypothetical protein [Alkalicoccobacillus plakortidis]|uniref:Uncharacterized protein n=1 Tax=Alkalicoccobacillus plakortidis TaxID=444060 RepID=A0ABT0XNS8_9BACI|nr:hypothetical protein [Alkalicoccobacillus plakortidis]MCM2677552.1 hypothetical protein [Alkalicoccobacillus plakortidis]